MTLFLSLRWPNVVEMGDDDPLTAEQLTREINALRELMEAQLSGIHKLMDAKFDSVAHQFAVIEQRRIEQKEDNKLTVNAALQAQKDSVAQQTLASERAIAKSEGATTKQLDQQTISFTTAIDGVHGSIADIKDRVAKIEATRLGETTQRGDTRAGVSLAMLSAGVILSVCALISSVLIALIK